LESFAIRQNSGGIGQFKGGNGGVRRVKFLESMTASILSNGRVHPAFGASGGGAGMVGINKVVRVDGTSQLLEHIAQVAMEPGDIFEIHTPGGGGFGVANEVLNLK
jgi:5-oxoprolinase (ATP-hydrolysing)